MRIKKGDKVRVIYGKDKGREGIVESVNPKRKSVVIPGINIYKKHIKKNEKMPQGGTVEIPRPLNIAKVMFICPKCGKQARVKYLVEKEKKFRICKKCKSRI